MLLKVAAHSVGFGVSHEFIGRTRLPLLKEESAGGGRYFLLKDTCEALGVKYSKIRSKIHRGKVDIVKLVLAGQELQDFKAMATYETTASHIAFVAESGFRELLAQHGVQLQCTPSAMLQTEVQVADSSPNADLQLGQQGSSEPGQSNLEVKARSDNLQFDEEKDIDEDGRGVFLPHSNVPLVTELIGDDQSIRYNALRIEQPIAADEEDLQSDTVAGYGSEIPSVVDGEKGQQSSGEDDDGDVESEEDFFRPLKDMPDVDQAELARGIKSVVKFKCYTLQDFEMTPTNHAEFHALAGFFSRPNEPLRGSRARNAQTIAKSRERICGYLGWLKQSKRKKHPSFVDFHDLDTFLDKYIDGYLVSIRGLAHGSVANAITAAIDVLKYLHAQSDEPFARCKKIARLKNRRNKEQTLADRQRNSVIGDDGTTILWEQFLEAVRGQRQVVDGLWGTEINADPSKLAPEVQRYLALALYAAIPPSRSKEVRLVLDRVLSEAESRKSFKNHIANIHGRHVLVVSDYKNRYSNGPQDSIELPADGEIIVKYLDYLMRPEIRTFLTKGNAHGFLFCKKNGDAFDDAGEWGMYLASAIRKHSGIQNVSTNALRHSFTTFMETEASNGDHTRLRESTAFAMRHTLRVQQQTYNNISPIQRKRKAVEFASGAFKRVVCENELQKCDGAVTEGIDLPLGAIVGTRHSGGEIAFGKVIRIDRTDAVLMLLKGKSQDRGTNQWYVADVGSVIRRDIRRELVYPVDGQYDVKNGVYEINTKLDEIDGLLL